MGGFYDQIAVGFAISNQYPTEEFAGYLEGSIAFHGDDGKVFLNGKIVGNLCNFGSHDIVGCGITNNGFVYFTHNGNLMYEYKTNFKGPVYPIISLRGKYSSVQINLEGGFLFNYEEFDEHFQLKQSLDLKLIEIIEISEKLGYSPQQLIDKIKKVLETRLMT